MKKQFSIKAAQTIKNIAKPVSKSESTNLLKIMSLEGECCRWDIGSAFTGLSKPVFSL
ncbi:hypothetical protein [Spirosoma sp. KCTC 42546]|uniref:hypothetical protein n=1 Tax=Spirosoma sp. KCTC 42546 TaxID=2520506 RepID=UPI00143D7C0E|nr:hypothetical protein [Spirosoma sp. KCTC 42546]